MSDFADLLNYCKAQAILNTLEATEESVWRSMCREYSRAFYTPLHLVLQMDMEEVMLAVFENQLAEYDSDKDLEALLDKIYVLENPAYEKQKQEELEEFIDKAEMEEQERLKSGKPIHPTLRGETTLKNTPENGEPPKENKPTGGSVNLAYLAREEES